MIHSEHGKCELWNEIETKIYDLWNLEVDHDLKFDDQFVK